MALLGLGTAWPMGSQPSIQRPRPTFRFLTGQLVEQHELAIDLHFSRSPGCRVDHIPQARFMGAEVVSGDAVHAEGYTPGLPWESPVRGEETIIGPEYGERWFCSQQEARQAGWRRSGV